MPCARGVERLSVAQIRLAGQAIAGRIATLNARSTSQICQEGSTFGMAEQRGCFVDDELAGPPGLADTVPHVSGDDVDGQWLELGREIPDLKNDQRLIEVDVRRPCKQSTSQRAADVSLEPSSEPAGQFVRRLNQDAM